jgi:hypothetical protein
MIKNLTLSLAATLPLISTLPVLAIAPGVEQAKYCSDYAADRFRLTLNQITITNVRQSGSNYRVFWSIPDYRGRGYCLISRSNRMIRFEVERQPQFDSGNLGPNEKRFNNLPIYGDVIVNRGQAAIADKQYFLLRDLSNGRTYKWYARCANNGDQVYDHRGKYVGYNRKLTVMFPYVCEISPLSSRPQPR